MADSALTFVGPINAEHDQVTKGESTALSHAIECGKLLNLAKENVKAEKKKWGPWLIQHCPKIPQTTASLYMRLAENESAIAKAVSIRDAIEILCRTRQRKPNSASSKPKRGSADLALLMNNSGPDEIMIAMKDVGVLEKVRDRVFEGFDAKGLSALLLQAWDRAETERLVTLLIAELKRPTISPSITPSTASPGMVPKRN